MSEEKICPIHKKKMMRIQVMGCGPKYVCSKCEEGKDQKPKELSKVGPGNKDPRHKKIIGGGGGRR